MTTLLAAYPDAEKCVIAWLLLNTSAAGVGHNTPADLDVKLPFYAVRRLGGSDDRRSDFASVDVVTFAASLSEAYAAAELARQWLTSGPCRTEHGVLDRVTTNTGPAEVNYENPHIVQVTANYRVTTRRSS